MATTPTFQQLVSSSAQTGTEKRATIWDNETPNLGCLIGSKTKTFFWQKRINGKRQRHTLGKYPAMTVKQARIEAARLAVMYEDGLGDTIEKRKQTNQKADTYLLDYINLEVLPTTMQSSYKMKTQSMISAMGKLLDVRLKDFSQSAFLKWRKNYVDELGREPATANTHHSHLRAILNRAVKDKYIDINPLSQTKLLVEPKKPVKRMSNEQIAAFQDAVERMPNDSWFKYALILMANTGLRPQQATSMKWEWFDLDKQTMFTPALETKQGKTTGRFFKVPITTELTEKLKLWNSYSNGEYLFPSPVKPNEPTGEFRNRFKRFTDAHGLDGVTPKQLRATFASIAASRGMGRQVLTSLMGHADARTTERYYIDIEVEEIRKHMESLPNG